MINATSLCRIIVQYQCYQNPILRQLAANSRDCGRHVGHHISDKGAVLDYELYIQSAYPTYNIRFPTDSYRRWAVSPLTAAVIRIVSPCLL